MGRNLTIHIRLTRRR